MAVTNFSTVDARCFQQPNPGGLRRVLVICSQFIKNPWPTPAVLDAENKVTAAPTYEPTTAKWAQYEFPDGTASVGSDGNGDPGYQSFKHTIEIAMAGFSAGVRKEIRKHLNAGSVWVVEMKDGQYVVVGSSDDPVFVKPSFASGKKGNDKRGYTLKGEVDGVTWDLPVLDDTLVASLPIEPLPVTP